MLGNDVKPRSTLMPPVSIDWTTEPGALYTLILQGKRLHITAHKPLLQTSARSMLMTLRSTIGSR